MLYFNKQLVQPCFTTSIEILSMKTDSIIKTPGTFFKVLEIFKHVPQKRKWFNKFPHTSFNKDQFTCGQSYFISTSTHLFCLQGYYEANPRHHIISTINFTYVFLIARGSFSRVTIVSSHQSTINNNFLVSLNI